jgi:F-type H+-transporting ATPase subunit a
MLEFLRLDRQPVDVAPPTLTTIGGLPVFNTLLTAVVVTVVLVVAGIYLRERLQLIPNHFQNWMEYLYEKMLTLIEQITSDRDMARRIFPLVGAMFVYIGVANLLTLLPGLSSITIDGTPLLRTPTADLNLPLALAAGSMVLIQVRAVSVKGLGSYLHEYFQFGRLIDGFRSGLKDGLLALVHFFVGLLDIIAEFAKVISLAFRLFGNMFAGELLAVLILGAFAYGLPAVWLSMNMLFAVVQALVFGALVAGYYTLAVKQTEGGGS